jgi:hypothetical protein
VNATLQWKRVTATTTTKGKMKPNKKTVRAAIRGSVPHGKLKKARIVLKDEPYATSRIAGFTQYDEKDRITVTKLGAPLGDNAEGITVRGHETRHATFQKRTRKKPLTQNEANAGQAVDDVFVETRELPQKSFDPSTGAVIVPSGLEEYRRAHIATAMKDLQNVKRDIRRVKAGTAKEDYAMRNFRLLALLRAKAIFRHYSDESTNRRTVKQARKGAASIAGIMGEETNRLLNQVMDYAKSERGRSRAISLLNSIMENEPVLEDYPDEPPATPHEDSDILSPVVHGDALDGHMGIKNLMPKSAFTSKEKKQLIRYSPDGVIINAPRYVNAMASGDGNGLFMRRIRRKGGGTVLIDASGSMGASAENLTELCKVAPTATIAYYSGGDGRGRGDLVIYAHKGRRYDKPLPEEYMHGGNAVDLPAVRWLLKQEKPLTLISDLEFCGGVLGSEPIAHALVERAQQRKELSVLRSLDAAYEEFGGNGSLSDAVWRNSKDGREHRTAMTRARLAREAEAKRAGAELAKSAAAITK